MIRCLIGNQCNRPKTGVMYTCVVVVAFAVSFHSTGSNFRVKASLTVTGFPWANHNSLLHTATNEIASNVIDNR